MENVCSDYALMPILSIVKSILSLIQIIVPILLIIMATVRLIELVKNPEKKNGNKNVINAFIAAAIVFFIPMFVNVLFQMLGNKTTLSDCWNKAKFSLSNTYYETETKNKNKLMTNSDEYEKGDPSSIGTCLSKNKTTRILFVGNSKTYVKDIPKKFANIASNGGYSTSVASVTEGKLGMSSLEEKL